MSWSMWARVRVPQMAFPSLDVPQTSLQEEDVLEMLDESIDRFEQSGFRLRRLCIHNVAGRCSRGWSCTFAHGEQELHPHSLPGVHRGRASSAYHGKFVAGMQTIHQEGVQNRVPAPSIRRKLLR